MAAKTVYVVVQKGIYRHAIVGVHTMFGLAKSDALEAIKTEPDDYHCYEVVAVPFDNWESEYNATDGRDAEQVVYRISRSRSDAAVGQYEYTHEDLSKVG
jgi:hypothetical protein